MQPDGLTMRGLNCNCQSVNAKLQAIFINNGMADTIIVFLRINLRVRLKARSSCGGIYDGCFTQYASKVTATVVQ